MNVITLDISTEKPNIVILCTLSLIAWFVFQLGLINDFHTLMAVAGGAISHRTSVNLFGYQLGVLGTSMFCGVSGGLIGLAIENIYPQLSSIEGIKNLLF